MRESNLTDLRLRELFNYDPATGQFCRLVSVAPMAAAGDIAGNVHRITGRRYITVDGQRYAAHRLAWLYVNGEWPKKQIDHINGDPKDNRIANLRDVSSSTNHENLRSARSDSDSGVLGVGWCKHHRKWKARIRVKGRLKHLKYCDSIDEARGVYLRAKRQLHAGCTI